ncbi:hypothetical protein P280DRAFT_465296 [Massarina eburnea CBS 473.64]|uniref:Uncharacterized protein n=1 Tax=Massarina eburnea CBS 473.64 TaxID=1395130 RepID=A0A6A6SC97_9PLEO|nr:hypothetical protein P280DRAFT_465296 [Massarina eburnea CBS 473.64]
MESGKGKGKETLWSGRKRNDSDTSFGCKGLSSSPQSEYPPLNPYRESHMQSVGYTRSRSGAATCRNPGPSGQNRRVVDGGSTGLVPSPLFSAGRRGKSLERKPSQVRNTIFYQPYDEVLNEYRK